MKFLNEISKKGTRDPGSQRSIPVLLPIPVSDYLFFKYLMSAMVARKKIIFDIKCVGCKNFKKKIAPHTEETLCLSFDTSFGTITLITWSIREIIWLFLVHFEPSGIF